MTDRKKVIKAYECCKNSFNRICEKCPYEKDCCHDGIPMFVIKKMVDLLKEQEKTIKDLLIDIEEKEKPELVNTDDENYAHLPITKCPTCKRPIRMYYDPCHTFLTKACPYCGKVVRWE